MIRRFLTSALLSATIVIVLASCAGGRGPRLLGPPDLTRQSDRLTGARLQMLGSDPGLCRAVIEQAGLPHRIAPPLSNGQCGYSLAYRLANQRSPAIALRPEGATVSCPVAAGLHLWLRDVVAPAAQTHLGERVTSIEHFGTYSCRRIYGGASGNISEHAHANAIDIGSFRLASGRQISVLRHWSGGSASERAFLREVRNGACRLFGTTLSPDYNAAHADHLHLDQANRRGFGYCR